MSNAKTKTASWDLHEYLSNLPFRENDQVFSLVGPICTEHARITLLAGLLLDARGWNLTMLL